MHHFFMRQMWYLIWGMSEKKKNFSAGKRVTRNKGGAEKKNKKKY